MPFSVAQPASPLPYPTLHSSLPSCFHPIKCWSPFPPILYQLSTFLLLPPQWHPFFTFSLPVPGTQIGLPDNTPTFIAMRVIPMGWLGAVDVMQAILQHILITVARISPDKFVSMSSPLPAGNTWLLSYIDGLDAVRRIPTSVMDALDSEGPDEHQAFLSACNSFKLPIHMGRRRRLVKPGQAWVWPGSPAHL